MEIVGWIGYIALNLCVLPQTIKTMRTKKADDISATFLLLWLIGALCMLTYALFKLHNNELIVNFGFNFAFNLACLLPILWFKLKGSK